MYICINYLSNSLTINVQLTLPFEFGRVDGNGVDSHWQNDVPLELADDVELQHAVNVGDPVPIPLHTRALIWNRVSTWVNHMAI